MDAPLIAGRMIARSCEDINDYKHSGNNDLHNEVYANNIDSLIQDVKKINVNDANVKGETPLHIAAKNKSPQGLRMLEILIAEGSDVNARNKWHQTPLHYAADRFSVENIDMLTKVPTIDVNAKDVNGYNPLQSLICSKSGDSCPYPSSDLQKAICILVQAGTHINNQTKYGHSILHLAAVRKENIPLLTFLISEELTNNVDLTLKDKMGENFLHVYAISEISEAIEMFSTIAKQNLTTIKQLLNEPNVMGRTPWEVMIDNQNASKEEVKRILGYGVSVRRPDNLGNTVLHRLAGVSTGILKCPMMQALIKGGACVNSKNVFGESAASVLFLEPVLEMLLENGLNCNILDRWGRSPLVSVMKHRPIPSLLKTLIEKGQADVNTMDMFGSTPLHFAAYHNYPEQIKMLLAYGADKDARDKLGDRPFDTMRRHCSYLCNGILTKADTPNDTVVYTRTKTFEDTLLDLPKEIMSSEIKTMDDVQKLLGLPKNLEQFKDNLMETYFNRGHEHLREINDVVNEINNLVKSLCLQIVKYDSRFKMTIFPTGSSAEGTKVGRPDEFDFVLCLDKLEAVTDIVMTKACQKTGFVCLKFKDTPESEEFLTFSDRDGYFFAFPFLQYFLRYLRRALNEPNLWKDGQLYYTFEDKMEVVQGKPVFTFNAYWVGSIYKQLKISIDLVPAVYKRGWWPPNINFKRVTLMTEAIRKQGCFLILQTQSNDFDKKGDTMQDCISQTCNNDHEDRIRIQQRMLRVSAAPAEICLVQTMPVEFRHAYALAKIVKSKEVCPEIKIDELPHTLLSIHNKFKFNKPTLIKPSQLIKSYMLKNCLFFALENITVPLFDEDEDEESPNTLQITSKIYEYLLLFADQQKLNPYFLPYSDVFEFETSSTERMDYDNFMLRLKRELSIKLVLAILKRPFEKKCLASRQY